MQNNNDNKCIFYIVYQEEQMGICSYNNELETDKVVSDGLYLTYGLNAAHAILPAGTQVEVRLNNDKKLIVTINNHPSTNKDVILEFSRETAKTLNIGNGEKVNCTITSVPLKENNSYYQYLKYILPYLALITFLCRLLL